MVRHCQRMVIEIVFAIWYYHQPLIAMHLLLDHSFHLSIYHLRLILYHPPKHTCLLGKRSCTREWCAVEWICRRNPRVAGLLPPQPAQDACIGAVPVTAETCIYTPISSHQSHSPYCYSCDVWAQPRLSLPVFGMSLSAARPKWCLPSRSIDLSMMAGMTPVTIV